MTGFLIPFTTGPAFSGRSGDFAGGEYAAGERRDWALSFAGGRLAGLAATFCLAPFMLAIPAIAKDAVPVLITALCVSTFGLIGLKSLPRAWHSAAFSAAGFVALGLGGWTGLSPATLAIAALTLVIEALAFPKAERPAGVSVSIGLSTVLLVGAIIVTSSVAGPFQGAVAAMLLPLAALVTLAMQVNTLRCGMDRQSGIADRAVAREEAMLSAADAAVVIVDRSGHVVDATDRARALFSSDPAALDGRGLFERVLIADRPAFLKAVSDAAVGGHAHALNLRMAVSGKTQKASHDFAVFSLDIRPSTAGRGQDTNGQASIRIAADVHASIAPLAVQDRGPLFAALSHEVRTPMNAILGFSEILASPTLCPREPAKIVEYAEIIHRSAQDSFAVTRAVVDLLRVESTPFDNAGDPVDAEEMLRAAIGQVLSREAEGAIKVTYRGEGVLTQLAADPRAVRMLFAALVEGLTVAVGAPAEIECTLAMHGLRPSLELEIAGSGDPSKRGERSAFLGVLQILSARLAAAIGAELELSPVGRRWHARLLFSMEGRIASLRPRRTASNHPNSVVTLRKSA